MSTGGSRREYLGVLLTLVAGGVAGLLAAGRPWGTVVSSSSFSTVSTEVTGNDLAPLVSAASLVALAAVVLVPAVRRLGRRVAGAVLALLGLAVAVNVLVVASDLAGRVEQWAARSPDHLLDPEAVDAVTVSGFTAALAIAGAAAVTVAGLFVAVRGPSWPGMGARYERPARGTDEGGITDPARAWDALDRGDDPTT